VQEIAERRDDGLGERRSRALLSQEGDLVRSQLPEKRKAGLPSPDQEKAFAHPDDMDHTAARQRQRIDQFQELGLRDTRGDPAVE